MVDASERGWVAGWPAVRSERLVLEFKDDR